MRNVAVLGVLALLCAASTVSGLSDDAKEFLVRKQFEEFKNKYGKTYPTAEEEAYRLSVFKQSLERVAKKDKSIFGITKFSDLTPQEFRQGYLTYRPSGVDPSRKVTQPSNKYSTPTSFDWRSYGAVTPVKDQGYCGSCWAFSTTETIESAWYLAGNPLTEFSVAQIVQCDTKDAGCNGGDPPLAYEYVESAGGLATEADYPYPKSMSYGVTGTCSSSFTVSGGDISGYSYATTPCTSRKCDDQDEDTLAANLASEQPASICVDASTWSDYTGGVMDSSDCSSGYYNLDHCVQLVGYSSYGSRNGYWIVRNSWGTSWGEDGYIYLALGSNTCGVADEATFVQIA